MKRIALMMIASTIVLSGFSQTETPVEKNSEELKMLEQLEQPDTTRAEIDTTKIRIGRKEVSIFEDGEDTQIRVRDVQSPEVSDEMKTRISKVRKFKGHWSGFEMGLNNFVNADFSTSLSNEMEYMSLRSSKSFNVNINFMQYNLRIAGDNFGLVTGMGLEFNDYRFRNNVSITPDGGTIVPVDYDLAGMDMEKTKLSTSYLTIPLLVEFQTPHAVRSHRVHMSAGVIGGVRLGSHTKTVYREGGRKMKDKVKDDFYLSPFRYGFTFRAGYRNLNLFANYYATPLFEKNRGPELYPFSIGLSLLGF
jgi:hypothetical protein